MTTLMTPLRPVPSLTVESVPPRWFTKRVIPSCTAAHGPLLTRYHVIATRAFGVYLHHLHTSDEDRALHDHPWSFVSILLTGGYFEWTDTQVDGLRRHWRRPLSILYRPAEHAHRLELVRPVWTLVIRFRVRRHWGFFTRDGWLPWRAYSDTYCDD